MQFDHFDHAKFDRNAFLRDHWQKRSLLIRNPWRNWVNPLAPDELAGLACEDEVESRLIRQARGRWTLEHGPLSAARFARLGDKRWTLLVQAVDHWVPGVAALIDPFRFIPNWRIDDVMVSYATDQGGVGPHFDQYDVFLIQGLGTRRWRVGGRCDKATPLLPHDDLRLLAAFEPVDEWLLGPGDILYVPPGVAHDGIAVGGDCMTYSVGFRAPSRSELIADWCDHLPAEIDDDDRYADPDLVAQANPGEIAPAAIAQMQAMVAEAMSDRAAFARWAGRFATTPKSVDATGQSETPIEADQLRAALAAGTAIVRNPASRFAFVREEAGAVTLFVDGEAFDCTGPAAVVAEQLCAQVLLTLDAQAQASEPVIALLVQLFDQGSITLGTDD